MMASANPIFIDYADSTTKHKFHLPLSVFKKPTNQDEYDDLQNILDEIIDEIKENEDHPLATAAQIIGDNLEDFDDKYSPKIGQSVTDVDLVRYLMSKNNLNQSDMVDIFGNQGNVSKFLNGERSLSKGQIAKLVGKFHISADFFFQNQVQ
jgi:HTH-type transcriptional regulator / antitoxin HigA